MFLGVVICHDVQKCQFDLVSAAAAAAAAVTAGRVQRRTVGSKRRRSD